MQRHSLLITAVTIAALGAGALATVGGAQSPDGRTITFLDDIDHASQAFIDVAPKSPARDARSPRFRLSAGDTLYVRSPIRDRRGGTRIGTAYSEFTVVRGDRFENATLKGHGTFRLHDGQLVADGVLKPANASNTIAVIGGTGNYVGARGTLTFGEVHGGSQDTFHLLP